MAITPKGKLYARMVYNGQREWEEGVPEEYRFDCWDSYTNYYHYTPPIDPPTP